MHQEKRITNVADLKVVLEQDADMLGPLVAGLMQKIFKPEMIEYLMAAKGERTGAQVRVADRQLYPGHLQSDRNGHCSH